MNYQPIHYMNFVMIVCSKDVLHLRKLQYFQLQLYQDIAMKRCSMDALYLMK